MFRSASAMFSVIALFLSCSGARATSDNSGDPIIVIAGGGDAVPGFPLGNSFSILSPSGTSPLNLPGGSACEVSGIELPLCLFSNGTEATWTTLTFLIAPGSQTGVFTCLALAYFSKCRFSDHNQSVVFAGGQGIASGDTFLFAVVSWLPNTTFSGKATRAESGARLSRPLLHSALGPRPEPSLAQLFLDGHVPLRDPWGRAILPFNSDSELVP